MPSGRLRLAALILFIPTFGLALVGGSISGAIKDSSGGLIPGAMLALTNTALGTQFKTVTDNQGLYTFPSLPVGRYELTIEAPGFKTQKKTGLVIDADSALQVNATLEVGQVSTEVSVTTAEEVGEVHVETVATQLGEVVSDIKMTNLSLNGRSYTDLLAIQPGIAPITTMKPNSVIMAGVTGPIAPSGELSAGNVSISGQRESANGFLVNGGDVQEHMNGGTGVVPNLDSISEFRVLTNNFDPEYGNYNGGIVNVVTKSGSDAFHGNVFEFLRNTALDSRNFFAPERAAFRQNQFGGTLGGPIRKQKVFFFGDYQGTRTTQGVDTGLISVPTSQQRGGDFSGDSGDLSGAVNGNYWANLLSQRLGYTVSSGERYYTPGCTSTTQCVLPNAVIPQRAWSTPAQRLLQYIPQPNSGDGLFSTSAFSNTVRDGKGSARIDANSRFGFLSAYYFNDRYTRDDPYPGQQGGASVPGFDALTVGQAQLFSVSATKAFGASTVNEFHFSVTRNANDVGRPHGGTGVGLASQGFVTGPGTPGIVVQAPQFEGVENIVFNSFVMGVTITGVDQNNTTYHWSDNVSRVRGAHTLRFGGQFHYDQVNMHPNATFNGTFTISGTETGSDFADFLLGIPSNYIQTTGGGFYLRDKYAGFFGQDSWRVRNNLTLNYGLRWDFIEPFYEKYNQIQTIVQGQQSTVYPGAPNGLVFPGDRGIPRTLSPASYTNFAPRIGLAYSPNFSGGILKTIFGNNVNSSIRAGFGLFYTAFQGLSAGIMYGVPPYGYNYLSPAPPLFDKPFITAADGTDTGQRFPFPAPPLNASAQNPQLGVDFKNYIPVNAAPYFFHDNHVPYDESYMLSIQRQIAAGTLLTVSYAGNQGHHLMVVQETNPGDPALCLSLSDPSQVASDSPTCGPFAENGVFTRKSGEVIKGTRGPLGPNFGTVTAQKAIANSNYNAFEVNLRYAGKRSDFLLGYTFSKSIDEGSNLGEQINLFNIRRSRSISSFDMKHNFVASYNYTLPFDQFFRPNRLTEGWTISGTTRFSTGFPVTMYNNTDSSLLGTFGNGVNNDLVDSPNFTSGPLQIHTNPRDGQPAFNTSLFSLPSLGQQGTSARRFFYGPGVENFDLTLAKRLRLSESKSIQFRLEAFNVFNHAQFYGPASVDGNISNSTFGQVVSAAAPRLVQLATKINF
jgi:Carboxypeptidase regulatory-like domain